MRPSAQHSHRGIPAFALLSGLCVLAALAGCATTPKPVVAPPTPPHIAPPSLTALADCLPPVKLAAGPATQQQVEIAWGVDVDHLVECGARHRILANYIRKRDAGLTAAAAK